MVQKRFVWADAVACAYVEKLLKGGQIVAGTSDTVAGLLAPLTQQGFDALNMIKGRSNKPYLVLLPDKTRVAEYCTVSAVPGVLKLMGACWPGPLTLILPAKPGVPSYLAHQGAIAVRVPQHRGLLTLLAMCGGLFSTSANYTGQPVPERVDSIDNDILDKVAAIIVDQGVVATVPSTILDCTHNRIKVIREGVYGISALEEICGVQFAK